MTEEKIKEIESRLVNPWYGMSDVELDQIVHIDMHDLIEAVRELHDALEEYGEHNRDCAFLISHWKNKKPTDPCDCGLDKILYGDQDNKTIPPCQE